MNMEEFNRKCAARTDRTCDICGKHVWDGMPMYINFPDAVQTCSNRCQAKYQGRSEQ